MNMIFWFLLFLTFLERGWANDDKKDLAYQCAADLCQTQKEKTTTSARPDLDWYLERMSLGPSLTSVESKLSEMIEAELRAKGNATKEFEEKCLAFWKWEMAIESLKYRLREFLFTVKRSFFANVLSGFDQQTKRDFIAYMNDEVQFLPLSSVGYFSSYPGGVVQAIEDLYWDYVDNDGGGP